MIFFIGLGPLLTGKRLQLIAKASHRNGAIVRPPAILRAGAELCTAITCQPSSVFSSSGEPLSPVQGVTLMRQYAGLRPPCHDAIPRWL